MRPKNFIIIIIIIIIVNGAGLSGLNGGIAMQD